MKKKKVSRQQSKFMSFSNNLHTSSKSGREIWQQTLSQVSYIKDIMTIRVTLRSENSKADCNAWNP